MLFRSVSWLFENQAWLHANFKVGGSNVFKRTRVSQGHQQVLKSDLDRYYGSIMDWHQQVLAAFQFLVQTVFVKAHLKDEEKIYLNASCTLLAINSRLSVFS